MNAFEVMFWVGLCLFIGWLGEYRGTQNSAQEIQTLQTKLEHCENMWKLDTNLFYPELCQTVCVEEFEKMGC